MPQLKARQDAGGAYLWTGDVPNGGQKIEGIGSEQPDRPSKTHCFAFSP
jgi:hypothetical protein